ncbi:MAG TPA: ProQ/FinO family protein [Noviherbaspirillum sp.]|jgi:ProP effector|uniref:ProQ/FinO family protein n=1 Tax=Noviherbaspirillum sp. TaxID=1926288 RepID=UPI002F93611C
MSNTTTDAQQKPSPRGLLKQLQDKYAVFRDFLPLAIGIDKQVIAAMPEVDRKTLRIALGIHTGSNPYLKHLKDAQSRFGLEGGVEGEVSEEHRTHAKNLLAERRKKAMETRKALQAEQEAAEAERRRAEKLAQLAAKFSPSRR